MDNHYWIKKILDGKVIDVMNLTKKQMDALIKIGQKEFEIPSGGSIIANTGGSLLVYAPESFGFPQTTRNTQMAAKADLIMNSLFTDGDFYLVDYPRVFTRSITGKYRQHIHKKDVLLLASRDKEQYYGAFQSKYVNWAFEALGPKTVMYIGNWNGKPGTVPILLFLSEPFQTNLQYGLKAIVGPLRNFDFEKYKKWR